MSVWKRLAMRTLLLLATAVLLEKLQVPAYGLWAMQGFQIGITETGTTVHMRRICVAQPCHGIAAPRDQNFYSLLNLLDNRGKSLL